jgi:tetratricopeptide (TPR) repeat protein
MPDPTELLKEGLRAEKLGILDRALAAYREAAEQASDPGKVAEALLRQADVLRVQCEWEPAIDVARRAQDVASRAGLPVARAQAVNAEASVHLARGDLARARPLFEQIAHGTDDLRLRGIALQNLGSVSAQEGDLDQAERMFAQSVACFRDCGYERGQAIALNNQGRVALDRRDVVAARRVLERAVDAARQVEDEELIALSTTNLSEATLATADYERAHDLVCSALGHFRSSSNRWREVECLRLLGVINAHRGHRADARRCYERALHLAREIDARLEITALTELLAALPPDDVASPAGR